MLAFSFMVQELKVANAMNASFSNVFSILFSVLMQYIKHFPIEWH